MATPEQRFTVGNRKLTLKELRALSAPELRALVGAPKTASEMAAETSKQFEAAQQPELKAPSQVKPLRVRTGAAFDASPVPTSSKSQPAPPSVPATPAIEGPKERPDPESAPVMTRGETQAVQALMAPTRSPRDTGLAQRMREQVAGQIIRRADDERAVPGTRGYVLAQKIVEAAKEDPDLVPIYDEVDIERTGLGPTIHRIAQKKQKELGIPYEEALQAAKRIANAHVTIGDWPPGFVGMPETLDPAKKLPAGRELVAALKPQVEIVGFSRRGKIMTPRAESPVAYLFRIADLPQSAAVGAIEGIAEGKEGQDLVKSVIKGIREGRIFYDAANTISAESDWVKENPLAELKLKQLGIGLTLVTPGVLGVAAAGPRAAKLVSKIPSEMVARQADRSAKLLNDARSALDEGDNARAFKLLADSGKIESQQRKKATAMREAISIEEARLVEKEIELGDPDRIADEELAKALPGQAGKDLISMNPSDRRHKTEINRVNTQDFRTLFDFQRALKQLLLEEARLAPFADVDPDAARQLADVRAGINATKKNISIRAEATATIAEAVRSGKPTEVFRAVEETETPRAADVLRQRAEEVGATINPNFINQITETGRATIPDTERIKELRSEIDALAADVLEAQDKGVPVAELQSMVSRLKQARLELQQGPTREITANELAQLQDDLELASRARLGVARPSIREREAPAMGLSPSEELEAGAARTARAGERLVSDWSSQVAELQRRIRVIEQSPESAQAGELERLNRQLKTTRAMGPIVKGVRILSKAPSWFKAVAFGLDADADLRALPKEISNRIKAGTRWVDQTASDYNQVLTERNRQKEIEYLTGQPVKSRGGQRYASSGYNSVESMKVRLQQRLSAVENPDALVRYMEQFADEGDLGFIRDLDREQQVAVTDMIKNYFSGDQFLDEIFRSVIGRTPSSTQVFNPPDIELLETLMYISGVTRRQGKHFDGTNAEGLAEIFRKIEAIQGAQAAEVFGQVVAVSGAADEVVRAWSRQGIAIPPEMQSAFGDLLQGKTIHDPALRAKVLELAERVGLGASFSAAEGLATSETFIPLAARERLADSLARALPSSAIAKGQGAEQQNAAAAMLREIIQLEKSIITRGHVITRPEYAMYNSFDRFAQMALETGLDTAAVTWIRQAAVDLTAIPLVENALRVGIGDTAFGARGEKARDILQAGGDRLASALNKLFGAAGHRLEVNKIMDAGDDVITLGDKTYTAKVLNKIFVEEGAASAFDNTELRSIIQNRRELRGLGPLDPSIASQVAESISVRERYGAAITLIEQGYEPRKAMQFVNKAYYDYATSVAKGETTDTGLGLILQTLDPFLAYTKNATRQIYDAVMTPEAAYKMGIIRRAMDEGAPIISEELYNLEVDQYGVDVDALPDNVRQDYFVLKSILNEHYKGKVPEGVQQAVRTIALGQEEIYEGGRLRQLKAIPGLREFINSSGLRELRQAVPPRPDVSRSRFFARGRPQITLTPDMSSQAVRDYMNSQPTESRSSIAFLLPEDTIHGGMKRMLFSALVGASMVNAGKDAWTGDDVTRPADILRFAGEYFDPARSPVIGPAAAALVDAKVPPTRISKTMANLWEHSFPGVPLHRSTYGRGASEITVYKLPPGYDHFWKLSGAKDLDNVFKRIAGNPQLTAMEKQGMIYKAITSVTGIPIIESNRARTADLDMRESMRTLQQK